MPESGSQEISCTENGHDEQPVSVHGLFPEPVPLMSFRVSARTLLHLGAELISSDSVAFYELIKNALDARTREKVEIDVVVRIPYPQIRTLIEESRGEATRFPLEKHGADSPRGKAARQAFANRRRAALEAIDDEAPEAAGYRTLLETAQSWRDLIDALEEGNYIRIADTGHGLTLRELDEVYLTIGTPVRHYEREHWKRSVRGGDGARNDLVLGEKGVGRLSVMRLGGHLRVKSARKTDTHWNLLDIDWARFSEDMDALVEDIPVSPVKGPRKQDVHASGTTLHVSRLASAWSREKVEQIGVFQFSKIIDPFSKSSRFPVIMRYNGKAVEIPRFNRVLFDHAHATVHAKFTTEPSAHLAGRIEYLGKNQRTRGREREMTFAAQGAHLLSIAGGMDPSDDITPGTLQALGPFEITLYWYNRRILTGIDAIGDRKAVLALLRTWGGGVMVYRDGFRVLPYGSPDDDWLDLDRKALASSGYKVNRAQIIGKVDISSVDNPCLVDQTNREGLSESAEKRVLVRLLKWILEDQMRGFLKHVDDAQRTEDAVSLDDLEERLETQDAKLESTLARFVEEFPNVERKYRIRSLIRESRQTLEAVMAEVRQRAESYETGRAELVHLAGVGLMVEILAHELSRATDHTLETLADANRRGVAPEEARLFRSLEAQLKTLQKRLRTLDPLSTRGRQVKESFDLVGWVRDDLATHQAQFRRHGIRLTIKSRPERGAVFRVHAVRGMVLQVIENLVSNSVYWLKQEKKLRPGFTPEITVTLDAEARQVRFSDNGPGIEVTRRELVFRPFHSTKPPGAGSGLGLYIAREIAEYNGASLYLDSSDDTARGTLHTFVLDFAPTELRGDER